MNSSSSSDELVRDMLSYLKPPMPLVDKHEGSVVASFYENRSLFITGATGFIGKALIEKLLRSCEKVRRIYILVREKRGKDIQERLADLIKSESFDRIRQAHDGSNRLLEEKLFAIKGDITLPKFGIAADDLRLLSEECSIVFNSAATIRFVEPIDVAVRNNIYSVGQLIDFCDELQHLEAIVHLSTAYSNCHKRDTIHEIFYDPPMRGHQIQETMDMLKQIRDQFQDCKEDASSSNDEDKSQPPSRGSCKLQRFCFDRISPMVRSKVSNGLQGKPDENEELDLLKKFTDIALRRSNRPNTYTFTKAISESYLLDKVLSRSDRYLGDRIPVAVVRPSIVGGAWREPVVGLVDNFNGPTGAILSLYTGTLQAMPGVGQRVADIVPVDMATNMVLSAGWFLISQKSDKSLSAIKHDQGVYLFNFVSGPRNPLTWETVTFNIAKLAYKYPSKFLTRLPSSYFIRAGRLYDLYDLINQKLPAFLIDLVQGKLIGRQLDRKSSAMFAYSRVHQITETLTPFTSNQWKFSDTNVRHLFDALSPIDKSIFHFDVTSISWPDYIVSYIIGSRIYALRDEPKNVPKALAMIKQRKLINGLTMALLFVFIYYFFMPGYRLFGN